MGKKLNLHLASNLPSDIEELSSLVSDIEADRKGVPVLLKQYVKLGGKLVGFNIDPSFGMLSTGLLSSISSNATRGSLTVIWAMKDQHVSSNTISNHRFRVLPPDS